MLSTVTNLLKLLNGLQPPDPYPRLDGKTARMNHLLTLYLLLNALRFGAFLPASLPGQADQNDYTTYHQTIARAQQLIARKHYCLSPLNGWTNLSKQFSPITFRNHEQSKAKFYPRGSLLHRSGSYS